MGLFTTVAAAKYGKSKALKEMTKVGTLPISEFAVCDHCGHPLYRHAPDARRTCPTYVTVS
jgi:hypothetical protein